MATIRDVAKLAGVSIGTVDRILHERGRYSKEASKKVWTAVKELDYKPNITARNLSMSKSFNMGVLIPFEHQGSGYWGSPLRGMLQAVKELDAYRANLSIFNFDRFNAKDFVKAAYEMLNKPLDGYLIAPVYTEQSLQIMSLITPQKPVVFFNSDLSGCTRLCYIGQNSFLSGQIAARLMRLLLKKSNYKTLLIRSNEANIHLENRTKGYIDNLGIFTKVVLYDEQEYYNKEKYYRMLDEHLNNEIKGIFVTDASVFRVADYLYDKGLKSKISLIGCDLTYENRIRISNDQIDFLLTQRPVEMGYEAVNILYRKIILEEKIFIDKIMPIDILTQENQEYFNF